MIFDSDKSRIINRVINIGIKIAKLCDTYIKNKYTMIMNKKKMRPIICKLQKIDEIYKDYIIYFYF